MTEPLQFSTARLLLRELQKQDIDAVCAYSTHPEVRRRLLPHQRNETLLRHSLAAALAAQQKQPRQRYYFVLHLHQGDSAIGCCTLHIDQEKRAGQIGWDLNHAYWGQGYMPEAAARVTAFAFQTTDITVITADCAAANRASIRVMQKIGMTKQPLGLLTRWILMLTYQQWQSIIRYTITRAAFEEQQQAAQGDSETVRQ